MSVDSTQTTAANEAPNDLPCGPSEFDQSEVNTQIDNTREGGQSIPSPKQVLAPPKTQSALEPQTSVLDVQYELSEMKKNFSHYAKTDEFNRKKIIDDQVTRQHTRITDAANAEEFISPLLGNIDYVNNYGKGKIIVLLGDLANRCSDPDLLYDIYETAAVLSVPKKIQSQHPTVIKNVVTNAIKTIGETRLPSAESHLINLITQEIPLTIRPIAVYSIGKCCHSVNALEHLKRLIEYGEDADHIAINWAFGKMGSREHENPLSIQEFEVNHLYSYGSLANRAAQRRKAKRHLLTW